jgi:hypothetical protein
MGARSFQNRLGRFLNPDDPGFGDPGDPHSMNQYAYAANNPLRWVDPSGHVSCPTTYCVTVTGTLPGVPLHPDHSRFEQHRNAPIGGTSGSPTFPNWAVIGASSAWPIPGYCSLNSADSSRNQGGGAFGDRRNGGRTHQGIDIAAPVGAGVVAAFSGTVVSISPNPSGSYGHQMILDLGGTRYLQYAHLNGAALVQPGTTVQAGALRLSTSGRAERTITWISPPLDSDAIHARA